MKFGLRSPFARAGPRLSTGSSSSGTSESQGGNLPDDVPLNSGLAGHSDNPNAGSSRNSRDLNSTGQNSHGSVGSREAFATAQQIHSPTNQEIALSGQPANISPLKGGISFSNHGHAHGYGAKSMLQDKMPNIGNGNGQVTSPRNNRRSVARNGGTSAAHNEVTTATRTGHQATFAHNSGQVASVRNGRQVTLSGAVPQPGGTAEAVEDPFPAPKEDQLVGVGTFYNGHNAFYLKLKKMEATSPWDIPQIDAITSIYKTWLNSGNDRATTNQAYENFKHGRNGYPKVKDLPKFTSLLPVLPYLSIFGGHLHRRTGAGAPKIIVPKSRAYDVVMDVLWKFCDGKQPTQIISPNMARTLADSKAFKKYYMTKNSFKALVVDSAGADEAPKSQHGAGCMCPACAPEAHGVNSQRLQLENGGSDHQYPEYSGSTSSLVVPKGEIAVAVFARQQEGESVRRHALESKKEDNRAAEQLRRDQLEANREAEQARRDKEEREERKEERAERAKNTAALTNLVGLLKTTIVKQDEVIGAVTDLSTTIKKKKRRRRRKNRHKSRRRHKQGLQSHGSSSEESSSGGQIENLCG